MVTLTGHREARARAAHRANEARMTTPVALVTGSSRGIGRGIAEQLSADGFSVVVTGRDRPALESVVAGILAAGGVADFLAVDLREPEAATRLVDYALARGGRLDVLVNNAGATKRAPFLDLTDADWADGFALKVFGAMRLVRAAWPHLMASAGSVVNIAGIGGRTPGAQFAVGGSVNAALLSATKALAETGLADRVQVNLINPGAIRTDRLSKRLATLAREQGIDGASAEAAFVRAERVTRIGEPADIASLVSFLVSPRGRFLHGALIDADGGATKSL